jgi:hypothetical protein
LCHPLSLVVTADSELGEGCALWFYGWVMALPVDRFTVGLPA